MSMRTTGGGVGRGGDVGKGVGVGLGPGVMVGVVVGGGAGSIWQADRTRMSHSPIHFLYDLMRVLYWMIKGVSMKLIILFSGKDFHVHSKLEAASV